MSLECVAWKQRLELSCKIRLWREWKTDWILVKIGTERNPQVRSSFVSVSVVTCFMMAKEKMVQQL